MSTTSSKLPITQFRILVIGRANSGKTAILRRLGDTLGEPMLLVKGKKIESTALSPSLNRAEHNIEDQVIFGSSPGFVFHECCGFEAGGAQELKLVQEFIKGCLRDTGVNEQLDAIWYCIPTSDDRPITAAEKKFFNGCETGLVPVIVLWTKTDSLDLAKIKQLINQGISKSDAMRQAPEKAWADFEKDALLQFDTFKYPPKAHVVLRDMDQAGADCKGLIEKTMAVLTGPLEMGEMAGSESGQDSTILTNSWGQTGQDWPNVFGEPVPEPKYVWSTYLDESQVTM